jgi:hypothetical protein
LDRSNPIATAVAIKGCRFVQVVDDAHRVSGAENDAAAPPNSNAISTIKSGALLRCGISALLTSGWGQNLKLPHCDNNDWFTSMSRH